MYVADRLVLPTLSADTLRAITAGTESFDRLTRAFVHHHLTYSFVEVLDGSAALAVEAAARAGGMTVGPPTLNPLRART